MTRWQIETICLIYIALKLAFN